MILYPAYLFPPSQEELERYDTMVKQIETRVDEFLECFDYKPVLMQLTRRNGQVVRAALLDSYTGSRLFDIHPRRWYHGIIPPWRNVIIGKLFLCNDRTFAVQSVLSSGVQGDEDRLVTRFYRIDQLPSDILEWAHDSL